MKSTKKLNEHINLNALADELESISIIPRGIPYMLFGEGQGSAPKTEAYAAQLQKDYPDSNFYWVTKEGDVKYMKTGKIIYGPGSEIKESRLNEILDDPQEMAELEQEMRSGNNEDPDAPPMFRRRRPMAKQPMSDESKVQHLQKMDASEVKTLFKHHFLSKDDVKKWCELKGWKMEKLGLFTESVKSVKETKQTEKKLNENIFEDGFMKDKEDINGLHSYLVDLDILPIESTLHFATRKEPGMYEGPSDFDYVIDLDERGVFKCHVDNSEGKTVWEYNSEKEDEMEDEMNDENFPVESIQPEFNVSDYITEMKKKPGKKEGDSKKAKMKDFKVKGKDKKKFQFKKK